MDIWGIHLEGIKIFSSINIFFCLSFGQCMYIFLESSCNWVLANLCHLTGDALTCIMGILKGPCNRLLLPQVKSMGSPANTGTQWKTLIHAPQETLTSTTLWSSCSSHGQRAFQPTQGPDSRHIHPHLQKQVC